MGLGQKLRRLLSREDEPVRPSLAVDEPNKAELVGDETVSAVDDVVESAEEAYKAELQKKMDDFRAKVTEKQTEGQMLFEAQTYVVAEEISDDLDRELIDKLLGQIKSEIETGQKANFEQFNQGAVIILLSRLGETLFAGKPKEGVPAEIYYQAINEIGLRIAQAFDNRILMNTVYPGYAVQVTEHEVVNRNSGNKVGEVIRWGCEISGQPHTRMRPQVKAVTEEELAPFVATSFLFPKDF